jgi:hypothetical protein
LKTLAHVARHSCSTVYQPIRIESKSARSFSLSGWVLPRLRSRLS